MQIIILNRREVVMTDEKLNNQASLDPQSVAAPYKALTIDYALYEHHLENSDLTEDQKREFLDTLWNIIVNFVDLGFGVHPLQHVTGSCDEVSACEQTVIPPKYLTQDSGNMVGLGNNSQKEFRHAADDGTPSLSAGCGERNIT